MNLPPVTQTAFDWLAGRTIKKSFRQFDGDDRMAFLLDDGSVFVVDAEPGHDHGDVSLNDTPVVNDYKWGVVLVGLGLITDEQLDAECAREEEERLERMRNSERAQYERLKAKFEAP